MKEVLTAMLRGETLAEDEAGSALRSILAGEIAPVQVSAFLTAIQMRGIQLPELRGFHSVLRESGAPIDLGCETLDVCGTGGDGKSTFNISTLTAFVLAGAGIKVAKHGNASATSGCGSSDILAHLGVKFTADEKVLRNQIDRMNICYLHAPLFQQLMKAVAPVRREIGFRTFFNLLGPLLNPARPSFQFIGAAEPAVLRLYRYFLEDGATSFALVNSRDGYDEISLTGAADIVTNESSEIVHPDDFGCETVSAEALRMKPSIDEEAANFLRILRNEDSADEDQVRVILANAACAMRLVNGSNLKENYLKADESLCSGAAYRAFEGLKIL